MRAFLLALLGLLLAVTPAMAARYSDRAAPTGQQRAKASAPAATQAARTAPTRAAASRVQSTASRHSPAALPHGSRTVQAAPARGSRWGLVASAHARPYRPSSMTTRRGAQYAVVHGAPACRNGARNCRLYRVSAPQPMRWSQGLSPALNMQTSNCPAGTMATLATGHSNIVRCMPI